MARPSKRNLDYFMHSALPSKTKRLILARYGLEGYGIYWLLMEQISITDNHTLDLREDEEWKYFVDTVAHGNEKSLIGILDWMAERDKIDGELWEKRIVWSGPFIQRNSEAYSRRNERISGKPNFKNSKLVFAYRNRVNDGNMPTETELMHTETPLMHTENGLLHHRTEENRGEQRRTEEKRTTTDSVFQDDKDENSAPADGAGRQAAVSAAVLFDRLLELHGVGKATAEKWISLHSVEYLSEKLSLVKAAMSKGKCANPGAMLRKAIEGDWKPKVSKSRTPAKSIAADTVAKLEEEADQESERIAQEHRHCDEIWKSLSKDDRERINNQVVEKIKSHNGPISGLFANWITDTSQPQPAMLKVAAEKFRNEILLRKA